MISINALLPSMAQFYEGNTAPHADHFTAEVVRNFGKDPTLLGILASRNSGESEINQTYKFSYAKRDNRYNDVRPFEHVPIGTNCRATQVALDLYGEVAELLREVDGAQVFHPLFGPSNQLGGIETKSDYRRFLAALGRNREDAGDFCLTVDVEHFYPSITPEMVLFSLQMAGVRNSLILEIVSLVRVFRCGLPIGLTLSDLLARLVLMPVDWRCQKLQLAYARCQDDIFVWGDSEEELLELREFLGATLGEFGLRLSAVKSRVQLAEHADWTVRNIKLNGLNVSRGLRPESLGIVLRSKYGEEEHSAIDATIADLELRDYVEHMMDSDAHVVSHDFEKRIVQLLLSSAASEHSVAAVLLSLVKKYLARECRFGTALCAHDRVVLEGLVYGRADLADHPLLIAENGSNGVRRMISDLLLCGRPTSRCEKTRIFRLSSDTGDVPIQLLDDQLEEGRFEAIVEASKLCDKEDGQRRRELETKLGRNECSARLHEIVSDTITKN